MSNFNLFITYPLGVHSPEENFARTKDLFQRLTSLHPLLSSFSPTGKGKSYAGMLQEPLVKDLSFEQWKEFYQRVVELIDYLPGHNYHGITISYWNRIKQKSESAVFEIVYDAFSDRFTNYLMLTNIPVALFEPEILDDIMQVCIDSFDGYRAEYAWLGSRNELRFRYSQLWMKGDLPFPSGEDLGRYQPIHPAPNMSEQWHGGTRYVWPEHDPRILMQEQS